MFSLTLNLLLILSSSELLSSEEFLVRERAEQSVRRLVRDEMSWGVVRTLWTVEENAEKRSRLQPLWASYTPALAESLIPAFHPVWPMTQGKWKYHLAEPHVDRYDRWLREWRRANGDNAQECDCCGQYYGNTPPLFSEVDMPFRAVTREDTIRELSTRGPIAIPALRVKLRQWSYDDRRDYWWRNHLMDEGGELKEDVYKLLMLVDPALINRRFFDGRRENTPPE